MSAEKKNTIVASFEKNSGEKDEKPTSQKPTEQEIAAQQQRQQQAALQARFAQAMSMKPETTYQAPNKHTLVIMEVYAGCRETRKFDFMTSTVTIDKQYPNGQIVPEKMHFSKYSDAVSLERIRQKLIEFGGTPPELVSSAGENVRKKNPIGFHMPKPEKK